MPASDAQAPHSLCTRALPRPAFLSSAVQFSQAEMFKQNHARCIMQRLPRSLVSFDFDMPSRATCTLGCERQFCTCARSRKRARTHACAHMPARRFLRPLSPTTLVSSNE
eukprot:3500407-Pleurochrysis_carterae.AAC.2